MESDSRKSHLTLLSPELVFQILDFLDDEDDLLALRMTCKRLDFLTKDAHLKSIYETRTLYMVPASLHNLRRISLSKMNTRVRNLVVSANSPYPICYCEVFHELGPLELGELPLVDLKDPDEIVTRMRVLTDKDGIPFRSQYTLLYTSSIFTLAMSNLPNIRSIKFPGKGDGIANLSRSQFNLIYPSIGMVPGTRLPEKLFEACKKEKGPRMGFGHGPTWEFVTTAALLSGLHMKHLEEISDTPGNESMQIGLFNKIYSLLPSELRGGPSKLRILRLNIADAMDGRGRLFCATPYITKCFREFLTGVGPQLTDLRLSYQQIGGFMHFLPTNLPKLKRLELFRFCIGHGNLAAMMMTCPELQDLKLLECQFFEPALAPFELLDYPFKLNIGTVEILCISFDRSHTIRAVPRTPEALVFLAKNMPCCVTKSEKFEVVQWTTEEEDKLTELGNSNASWEEISKHFPDKTETSVKEHWFHVLIPRPVEGDELHPM